MCWIFFMLHVASLPELFGLLLDYRLSLISTQSPKSRDLSCLSSNCSTARKDCFRTRAWDFQGAKQILVLCFCNKSTTVAENSLSWTSCTKLNFYFSVLDKLREDSLNSCAPDEFKSRSVINVGSTVLLGLFWCLLLVLCVSVYFWYQVVILLSCGFLKSKTESLLWTSLFLHVS